MRRSAGPRREGRRCAIAYERWEPRSCTSTPPTSWSASRAARISAQPAPAPWRGRARALQRSSRGRLLLLDPLVPAALQLVRELLAAGLHDFPVGEYVNVVGHQVRQQTLVVRDHENRV